MHIFLEGIVTYEMKYLFKYLFDNRFFTLHDLNQAIDDFDYSYSELNDKPAHIKEVDLDLKSRSNLGQSASQMWSCMLHLLLDGKVDCNDPHWTTLLCLLEIMGICFAHKVSLSSVINLKPLIKEHLTSFKNVYPNARILPKQHYLVHLPT